MRARDAVDQWFAKASPVSRCNLNYLPNKHGALVYKKEDLSNRTCGSWVVAKRCSVELDTTRAAIFCTCSVPAISLLTPAAIFHATHYSTQRAKRQFLFESRPTLGSEQWSKNNYCHI